MAYLIGAAVWWALPQVLSAQPPAPAEEKPGVKQGVPDKPGAFRPGRPFEPPRMPLMTAIDTDGDGEISAKELANALQALRKLDKDGDGKLSKEELRPTFSGRGGFGGPFGPPGTKFFGPGLPGTAQQTSPLPKDDAEKKILQVLDEMNRTQRAGMMNVPVQDGRMLRLLAEGIGAETVVEIGTSNGYSGIWLCLALRKTGGRLITHEIDARRAALARENFAKAGLSKLVTIVEGDAHETVSRLKGPIDLVFIDADKEGYLDYLNKILPLVRPGGLIVAHNINPRMAFPDFVRAITTNPNLETVFYTEGAGMSVTLKKR